VILFTAAAPPFMKNGYVLGCERTREAVIIDPGDEVDELLAFVREQHLGAQAVLLTHAHLDHVSGVGAVKRALSLPVWLHVADQPLYDRAAAQGAMFGIRMEQPPPVDHHYAGDGTWGRFGDYEVSVHHTPGHCPGGVCLAIYRVREPHEPRPFESLKVAPDSVEGREPREPREPGEPRELEGLFVGDTLFAGSIGRTDLPGGHYETLMKSITGVLFAFPDDALVHTGHGPDTTIGHERRTNPFVLEWMQARRSSGEGRRS
jgi:glyoxylase-like metal-dependent hydrolase (beta-lactamase superfamily II)